MSIVVKRGNNGNKFVAFSRAQILGTTVEVITIDGGSTLLVCEDEDSANLLLRYIDYKANLYLQYHLCLFDGMTTIYGIALAEPIDT